MVAIDLSNFFQTKSQANDFSERLASVSEKTYETHFNLETALLDAFGIERKDKMLTIIRDAKIDINSANILKKFFDDLREQIAALPVLPITIAFEPKGQTLKIMTDWFTLNIKKHVLFDISVDPSLVAGASITFGGKFVDYSIRPAFMKIVDEALTKTTTLTQNSAPIIQNSQDIHIGR